VNVRRLIRVLLLALIVAMSTHAHAVQPDEVMRDPAQEARARALSRELRCMVCQNQSIDDSDAPLARDLRLLVRERISAGDSDGQVIDFLVTRYGAFVLLKPPFEMQTLLLWLLPPLALGLGAVLLLLAARRNRRAAQRAGNDAAPALTPQERARLAELLENKDVSPSSGTAGHQPPSGITKV
jgi:cytochrome c-type biogenesis protein CcmH